MTFFSLFWIVDLDYINSDIVTFFCDDIDINTIDLNSNLDDNDDDDLETIIHARLVAWCNEYKQPEAFKKELDKELMLVAWYPKMWWGWCMPEDNRKEIELFFIGE